MLPYDEMAATIDQAIAKIKKLRAENAALRDALRERVIGQRIPTYHALLMPEHLAWVGCAMCSRIWDSGDPEYHASRCLAAPQTDGGK